MFGEGRGDRMSGGDMQAAMLSSAVEEQLEGLAALNTTLLSTGDNVRVSHLIPAMTQVLARQLWQVKLAEAADPRPGAGLAAAPLAHEIAELFWQVVSNVLDGDTSSVRAFATPSFLAVAQAQLQHPGVVESLDGVVKSLARVCASYPASLLHSRVMGTLLRIAVERPSLLSLAVRVRPREGEGGGGGEGGGVVGGRLCCVVRAVLCRSCRVAWMRALRQL
jgi:hypothetical protein